MELVVKALGAWFAWKEDALMFSDEDLKCLDLAYFAVIAIEVYDLTIMFRNMGLLAPA